MPVDAAGEEIKEGEEVTLAVRSENIRLDGGCGLEAEVAEKSFAGGLLRVVLKLSDGTEVTASRYGIDAAVQPGEKVCLSFEPSDAVLVDRPGNPGNAGEVKNA